MHQLNMIIPKGFTRWFATPETFLGRKNKWNHIQTCILAVFLVNLCNLAQNCELEPDSAALMKNVTHAAMEVCY